MLLYFCLSTILYHLFMSISCADIFKYWFTVLQYLNKLYKITGMLHFGVKENCFTYNQAFIVISFFHIETFQPSGSHINSQETNNTYKKKTQLISFRKFLKLTRFTRVFPEVLLSVSTSVDKRHNACLYKCCAWALRM